MKITQINAYSFQGNTEISMTVSTALPVTEAISSVLALFARDPAVGTATLKPFLPTREEINTFFADKAASTLADDVPTAEEAAPAAKATRPRRPRTNPDAAPTDPTPANLRNDDEPGPVAEAALPAEPRRRTRVTAEPAHLDMVKIITDADLAKAASNAAAIVGTEIVGLVLAEFSVKMVSDLAPDVREKFIGELNIEIEAAREELAKAGS